MSKTFNFYCDESCHLENDGKAFMLLGKVSAAYNQVKLHTAAINDIKDRHHFNAEIKWTKVSKSKLQFYLDLVDYFFATDLQFRAVGIEKARINNEAFGQSYDDLYYKMYYHLLNHNISSVCQYNVYLDIKDTLSAHKVSMLKKILNTKYGVFRNLQNIRSHESILMQLADFLMGAISYKKNNQEKANMAKVKIIEKIEKHCQHSLEITNYENKVNLFFIELQ
jgi:hypothetical protein